MQRKFTAFFVVALLLCCLVSQVFADEGIAIDETNFPDDIFRAFVEENFDQEDENGSKDGILSPGEIEDAKEIV